MPVPLLDLKRQYAPLRSEIELRVREVIESQNFILGPAVQAFEAAVRLFCDAGCAIGMSSGTDAQLAALMALEIGHGDAVLTTPYTFFATAGCLSRVGARPIFVDIDPATFNLAPAALAHYLGNVARRDSAGVLRAPTGERLRAIIPVHLFGLCCEMNEIMDLGGEYRLPVLEDAAQALGAEYFVASAGRSVRAGVIGELGWFSFFPSKNLGAFGDAGMTMGRDDAFSGRLRALRMHGMEDQYLHRFIGGNFRLDALQAAVLSVKLAHLDAWSEARSANATQYRRLFERAGLLSKIVLPSEPHSDSGAVHHHIYNQFVIRVPARDRERLRSLLSSRGIGSAVYYPVALHQQECFHGLGYAAGDFPESEAAARESLALPVFPELTQAELEEVVEAVADFFAASQIS